MDGSKISPQLDGILPSSYPLYMLVYISYSGVECFRRRLAKKGWQIFNIRSKCLEGFVHSTSISSCRRPYDSLRVFGRSQERIYRHIQDANGGRPKTIRANSAQMFELRGQQTHQWQCRAQSLRPIKEDLIHADLVGFFARSDCWFPSTHNSIHSVDDFNEKIL